MEDGDRPRRPPGGLSRRGTLNPDAGDITAMRVEMWRTAASPCAITLTLDATARDWLAAKGWDPAYGARPLKRVIQRFVQDPLAEMILGGDVKDGDRVVISAEGNVLTFNGKAAQTAEIAQFEAPVPKRKLN